MHATPNPVARRNVVQSADIAAGNQVQQKVRPDRQFERARCCHRSGAGACTGSVHCGYSCEPRPLRVEIVADPLDYVADSYWP
jgi:hypothetical protein